MFNMTNQRIVVMFFMCIVGMDFQSEYLSEQKGVELSIYICNNTDTNPYYVSTINRQDKYKLNGPIPRGTTTFTFSLSQSRNVTVSDNKVVLDTFRDNAKWDETLKTHNAYLFQRNPDENGVLPYYGSIKINFEEICNANGQVCGKRSLALNALIVQGDETKPGDWPWHAALYRIEKFTVRYICGGTLISKTFVLTAAHCVTINGAPVIPDILNVAFGKYNLNGGNVASQEREVFRVIVHKNFDKKNLKNDIALLKLKSLAVLDDYVRPACIWGAETYNKLRPETVSGTVVGWGFNQDSIISPKLQQASFTILQDITCIRNNPLFYASVLDGKRFCAGGRNGTSPCNGDSGGGFLVFVPDSPEDLSPNAPGSWYVRGIVSLTLAQANTASCDPFQNAIFTDVAEHENFIYENIKNYDKK